MTGNTWRDTKRSWLSSGSPLTIAFLVVSLVVFVLDNAATRSDTLGSYLFFTGPGAISQPWRFLTYPLVFGDFIYLLFNGAIIYMFGSSLERSWGTRTYALFLGLVTLLPSAALAIFGILSHSEVVLAGPLAVLGALGVAWGMVNYYETVCFWGISIPGKWISVLAAAVVFFEMPLGSFFARVISMAGCLAAYYWVRARPWGSLASYATPPRRERKPKLRLVPQKAPVPADDRFRLKDLSPFEWAARKKRKKQFERLINDD